jgi:hypothetical protein
LRIARVGDGRALGLVAEGQSRKTGPGKLPDPSPWLWLASVNLETGAVGDPEMLAPVSLSDRPVAVCTGDDAGWELDVPYPGSVEVVGHTVHGPIRSTVVKLHLSPGRACVERLFGSADDSLRELPTPVALSADTHVIPLGEANAEPLRRTVELAVATPTGHRSLRCSLP